MSNLLGLSWLELGDVELYIQNVDLFMLIHRTHNSEKGVFLYNGGEEHRIYLDKNDPMRCVRYIDADGMIYDYPAEEEGNENFLTEQYSVLAMQELHWAGI